MRCALSALWGTIARRTPGTAASTPNNHSFEGKAIHICWIKRTGRAKQGQQYNAGIAGCCAAFAVIDRFINTNCDIEALSHIILTNAAVFIRIIK